MANTRRTPARMIIVVANMPATLRLIGSGVNAAGGGWGRGGLIHALLEVLQFGNAFFSRLGLVLLILRVPEARGVLFGVLRRDTDNQIKINRQLSGLRSFQGFEFLDEHVF